MRVPRPAGSGIENVASRIVKKPSPGIVVQKFAVTHMMDRIETNGCMLKPNGSRPRAIQTIERSQSVLSIVSQGRANGARRLRIIDTGNRRGAVNQRFIVQLIVK